MLSYIASLLGLQGDNNTTTGTNKSAASLSGASVSCRGFVMSPPPDPAIRLRLTNDGSVKIFGHPPQEDYPQHMWYVQTDSLMEEHYVHFLPGDSPACVEYVMGNEWRSQLRNDYGRSSTDAVILRPSAVISNDTECGRASVNSLDAAAEVEDRAHSLRMRRCGAVAICSESDARHYDYDRKSNVPQYLFGWPSDGGVWILRSSWSTRSPIPPGGDHRSHEEIMDDNWRKVEIDEAYVTFAETLKQHDDMEDVCQALKESGAQFYVNIEDCPEAVMMNLV